ncbi:MAG: ParB/RepB/Spo0J family partition protein [Bacteroidales bacterium]|nr:ParB/RepB/Spo0J family partition protein [Bacteroidales bacterium]
MAQKNALGRGLGALIEEADSPLQYPEGAAVSEIQMRMIEANPWQPRSKFDEEALDELADSIKQVGIIQPVTVRLNGDGVYQLITGERRFRAAKKLGLKTIPAFVRLAEDTNMLEMALIENIQREDLDAIEVAISYQRLLDECNLTQESLSERVGKKRSTVANYLRLLKLPAEIQVGIREKKITMGHARGLINLDDTNQQLDVFYRIVEGDLSVRRVEEMVRNLQNPPEKTPVPEPAKKEYEDLRVHLARQFGADVDFKRSNKGNGKIVISFKSDEDLERIIAILDKLNA